MKAAIGGKIYHCTTHSSQKERIGGMKDVYNDNGIVAGDVLIARYSASEKCIYLEITDGVIM